MVASETTKDDVTLALSEHNLYLVSYDNALEEMGELESDICENFLSDDASTSHVIGEGGVLSPDDPVRLL